MYRFLAADCGIYLPAYKVSTIDHLREVASNKRKVIYAKDVKHISIPHFEGLKIEAMLDWARQYPEVLRALPSEEREIKKLHRQWVANLIYTIVGAPFQTWVNNLIQARNQAIIDDRDLNIEMDE